MKNQLEVTLAVYWRRCADGMAKFEPADCAAVFGLDADGGHWVFETMESARDYHEANGLEWYAVVPWPELP